MSMMIRNRQLLNLHVCTLCPRDCHADRISGKHGYCLTGDGYSIGAVCAHRGEEPVISGKRGICNVFFAHCNLQCIYCQNWEISRNRNTCVQHAIKLDQLLDRIEVVLGSDVNRIGFVTPSHCIAQMLAVVEGLTARGHTPVYVYNTNAYDRVETLRELEDVVDVYLPDLKYMDGRLSQEYSDCPDYPQVASSALKEMWRQKGAQLHTDDSGLATRGLVIRHLVLPGQVDNSKKVLRFIAEELSVNVHVSLMSQYYPTEAVRHHPDLGRTLLEEEYQEAVDEFHRLGFHRGWVQEFSSSTFYRPSFAQRHPFEG